MDWYIGHAIVATGWALGVWFVGRAIIDWWYRR